MGMFREMLGAEESLFKNDTALSYEFVPKLIPFREKQQRAIAGCIKPLLQQRDGKHVLVFGAPGIGKTVAIRHLFKELEEETEEVLPIYINCWQKNSSFKVILELCNHLNYRFTQNQRGDELFKIVKGLLNKKASVICFDEVDKLEDFDVLYSVLEEIYKKTIILITNYREWFVQIDSRIKSRMTPEAVEFKPYSLPETKEILKQRSEYAFVPGVFEKEALDIIAQKTFELEDIRKGLFLLRESALAAEDASSRKVMKEHAEKAIAKIDDFSVKSSTDLKEETRFILNLIKNNDNRKIGELFKIYQANKGLMTYKTFQRHIDKLEKSKFITCTRIEGGIEGNTTMVSHTKEKKITDY